MEIKQFFTEKKGPQEGFSSEDALELFFLFANGSDKEPQASFKEGQLVLLSQYPPGTLIKSTWINFDHEGNPTVLQFEYFCIGDFDQQQPELQIFSANPDLDSPDWRAVDYSEWKKRPIKKRGLAKKRSIIPEGKDGQVELMVGGRETIIDMWLRQKGSPVYETVVDRRKPIQIDILGLGKKAKEPVKERKTKRVGVLKPVLDGFGWSI